MSVELKTIKLNGHLGKKFVKSCKLAVSSPEEAIKALSVNIKGFKEYLTKHSSPGYHIFTDKRDLAEDELNYNVSSDVIKIVPVTVGSGGFFKIVIGIAMIVAAIYMPYLAIGMTEFGLAAASALSAVGYSLVMSGISQVLFAPPKAKSFNSDKPENSPSYVFNGPVNTIAQGNPVGLCYGKVRVGSQVISAGLTSREIPI